MEIKRIEPLSWWVGMHTPLQLMVYGKDLAGSHVSVEGEGVSVREVHRTDNPDYLFVDVDIAPDTEPGDYRFTLRKGRSERTFDYRLEQRRPGSAARKSFDSSDVVYLIMPDRFANGDPSIEQAPGTAQAVDRKDPYGRHGGDLQGIIDHLDYLKELGVTTLWIAPFQLDDQKQQSYHGYACADFYRTDPRYGTNEKYRELVDKAHALGLKVIMDVVLNHCGSAHWWMKDLPMKDWIHQQREFIRSTYRLVSLTDPNVAPEDQMRATDGWFDVSMPDLALENPYVLQYFVQVFVWWIEWADLDGLRVDTFPYNDRYAGAEWVRRIREEYPNLRIVAECWHSSPAVVAYWDGGAVNHDGYNSNLPSVMDFPLQEAIGEALKDPRPGWSTGMNLVYEAIAHDFLFADPRTLLIFLDNHDIGRFADTVRGNPDKIKMGLTLLATLRGIPQLYYGTEYGFRSDDPAQGDGAARIDFPGGWKGDRKNLFTGQRRSRRETEIFEHARKLFNWRKNAKAVHQGKTTHYLPDDKGTYAYVRYTPDEAVFVMLNPTAEEIAVDWDRYKDRTAGYTRARNVLTGRTLQVGGRTKIPPRSSFVLELIR